MRKGQVNNVNYLSDTRKDLRNNATDAEKYLWAFLRSSKLKNRKFRRQHSIENYIVDFYCPAEKLIVELDGGVHDDPTNAANDVYRTNRLTELRFRVIRFRNEEVLQDVETVLKKIADNFSL